MKLYYVIPCLLMLLLSCSSQDKGHLKNQILSVTEKKGNSYNRKELAALESEMITFFQKTLEKNYGSRYAIDLLVRGMDKYYFNYILEVDKAKLRRINEKLYSAGWMYLYFLDKEEIMDDTRVQFVPQGMAMRQDGHSARSQQDLRSKDINNTRAVIVPDSALYIVENMLLPLAMYKSDGFSYFQKELANASHPATKKIAETIKTGGSGISPLVIFGKIAYNLDDIAVAFKSDKEMQMFLTLYFWKFLCHSANIDFYTGQDRTEVLMKEVGNSNAPKSKE